MRERGLPQGYLNFKADQIDRYCWSCHRSSSPKRIRATREFIQTALNELEEAWLTEGVDAKDDIGAFRRACEDCFENGREQPVLEIRFSCAIRTRLPEQET